MKIFKMNDYDWWMAETIEQAVSDYVKESEIPKDEAIWDVYELTDAQMDSHVFTDNETENCPTRTFKEELDRRLSVGGPTSEMFASTEY